MTVWRKGMKAVCVDDKWHGSQAVPSNPLRRGRVYVVTAIKTGCGTYKKELSPLVLHLDGVVNPLHPFDIGFAAKRFRPAVSRSTDISIFKALLRDPHKKISEDA